MTNEEKQREEAQQALDVCVTTRKRIDAYVRMSKKEQESQNPEETAKFFEHLSDCDNAWALEALTGSKSGSGFCKKQWLRLEELMSQDPHNFPLPVFAHMARIARQDEWTRFLRAREKRAEKPDMTPHYEFMYKKLDEWKQNPSRRK